MSTMKKVFGWFVTIEPGEGESAGSPPAEAAHEDPDEAARAAVEYVQAQESERGAQAPSASAVRRVSELDLDLDAGRLSDEALSAHFGEGSELAQPIDDIYEQHGLSRSDAPGFHVFGIEKLLTSQHLSGLDRRVKRASVMVTLEAAQVGVPSVLQDAVARDNALDQHEEAFRASLEQLEFEVSERVKAIEEEMASFLEQKRQEMADERARLRAQQDAFAEWQRIKRDEERRLFEIVGVLADEQNPITTT